jgi:hypothetical protein
MVRDLSSAVVELEEDEIVASVEAPPFGLKWAGPASRPSRHGVDAIKQRVRHARERRVGHVTRRSTRAALSVVERSA